MTKAGPDGIAVASVVVDYMGPCSRKTGQLNRDAMRRDPPHFSQRHSSRRENQSFVEIDNFRVCRHCIPCFEIGHREGGNNFEK